MATAQEICNLLNEARRLDPAAVNAMVAARFPCNSAMLAHPMIVADGEDNTVGIVGLLNGLFRRGEDVIAYEYEEPEAPAEPLAIVEFRPTPDCRGE